jgi:hypothetical protein
MMSYEHRKTLKERRLRMNSTKLIRWGVRGALLAGIGWMASGFFFYVFPGEGDGPEGSLSWYLIESADAVAEAGMLAALVGLHVRQTLNYGRLGTAGFMVAFIGTAFVLLSTVSWLLVGENNAFVGLLFSLGLFVGWLAGFPLLGVATFRAKVLPRWCGLLLIAFFPVLFVLLSLFPTGVIWNGLVWLALGYALWSERGASVGQSRVRVKT